MNSSHRIRQRYAKNDSYEYYSIPKEGKAILQLREDKLPPKNIKLTFLNLYLSLLQGLRDVFLPEGYPNSVSRDYIAYQFWDTMQAFCSSITNILAAQGVLKGSGVGDIKATAMAATITWLLKSGSGMLGSILFAWARGSHLDCYCKQWRLTADVLNDFATCVEILAPSVGPDYFLFVMCAAGIAKSIVGVAGGSTRAAVTSHQAIQANMGDVSAKDGSQETLVNLSALIIGLVMIPFVNENIVIIWFLYILLTALHLYGNYRAVRALKMEFVNLLRLQIIIRHYLRHGEILSIEKTNNEEPLFLSFFTRATEYEMGAKLASGSGGQFTSLERGFIIQKRGDKFYIALEENFLSHTILESIFYTELSIHLKKSRGYALPWDEELQPKSDVFSNEQSGIAENYRLFGDFSSKFDGSEWYVDLIKITTSPWRFEHY